MKQLIKQFPKHLLIVSVGALALPEAVAQNRQEDHGRRFRNPFRRDRTPEPPPPPQPEVRRAVPVTPPAQPTNQYNSFGRRPEDIRYPMSLTVPNEWRPVVYGTIDAMNQSIDGHFGNLSRSGIGTMYGPLSSYAKMSPEQQRAYIEQRKKPGSMPPDPKRTSCIDYVLDQIKVGYERAGKSERFNEIRRIVVANEGQGTYLLKELEKDGWSMVYWNPDVQNPSTSIRSENDPQGNHRPSHHKWTAATVRNSGIYMEGVRGLNNERFEGLKIDHQVLNFRRTNPTDPRELEALSKLYNAPLGVGIANGGFHVYLFSQGKIIESHSTRDPHDHTNIEVRDFTHEWGQNRGEGFGSGVIAVPPGSWR
jgi:hypothetical protein